MCWSFSKTTAITAKVAEGCEITSLGGTVLHISDGWGVVQGRVWSIAAQDISVTASTSGTVNGRLLLRLDTSLDAGSAAQLVTQAATTLPALNQEDTLSGGSVYELPLATYSVSETSVASLNQAFPSIASIVSMLREKAPTSHASTATTYGAGTGSTYGHVKLSDSTSSTSAASAGIAATPKAVKAAYDLANAKQAAITGAATTIASGDLTASRALISNASGKVAVSAVTSTELGYLDGVTSNVQAQINGKQATITGGATTIADSDLTASRALVSSSSGKVAVSAVTSTELGYLDGVTSAIQTQLNGKAASSHTQAASTITTGTFPANVKAYETARTTRGLFNEETRASSTTGTLQSVKYFINVT